MIEWDATVRNHFRGLKYVATTSNKSKPFKIYVEPESVKQEPGEPSHGNELGGSVKPTRRSSRSFSLQIFCDAIYDQNNASLFKAKDTVFRMKKEFKTCHDVLFADIRAWRTQCKREAAYKY